MSWYRGNYKIRFVVFARRACRLHVETQRCPRAVRTSARNPTYLWSSIACAPLGRVLKNMEAAPGFEPGNNGFADRRLSHLAMPPQKWSGKRDSNPRHQPWQGCALPTELFPQFICQSRYSILRFSLPCQLQSNPSPRTFVEGAILLRRLQP